MSRPAICARCHRVGHSPRALCEPCPWHEEENRLCEHHPLALGGGVRHFRPLDMVETDAHFQRVEGEEEKPAPDKPCAQFMETGLFCRVPFAEHGKEDHVFIWHDGPVSPKPPAPPPASGTEKPNDRSPNFRDETGKLFLVRCFVCVPGYGRENYGPAVASGSCAWCNFSDTPPSPQPASGTEKCEGWPGCKYGPDSVVHEAPLDPKQEPAAECHPFTPPASQTEKGKP